MANLDQFKGSNPEVPRGIWLIIILDRFILPTNIFSKFGEDQMITVQIRQWTKQKRQILTNSRAIILKSLAGYRTLPRIYTNKHL